LGHHKGFVVWKIQDETLCGFGGWRDQYESIFEVKVVDPEMASLNSISQTLRVQTGRPNLAACALRRLEENFISRRQRF
jgi:hypothetical protein